MYNTKQFRGVPVQMEKKVLGKYVNIYIAIARGVSESFAVLSFH